MGNSYNHKHDEDIKEDIICGTRRVRYWPKYILGQVSVIAVIFHHILNSKVIQQNQIELFGTEVDFSDRISNRLDRLDPNATHINIMFLWIAYFYRVKLCGEEPM